MTTVEIVVDADGQVSIRVQGVQGASCKDATKQIEAALGIVTRDDKTAEWYEKASAEQKLGRK